MIDNPYRPNDVQIGLFYGREGLRQELVDSLTGGARRSFGIAGARRMGKTTLLRRVEVDLRAGIDLWKEGGLVVVPVYIDGQALDRPVSANTIWKLLLEEIASSLPVDSVEVPHVVSFQEFKRIVFPLLTSTNLSSRIVVLFDEMEPILSNDQDFGFLSNWRALLSNTPEIDRYFCAVFSGAKEMSALQVDFGSPIRDILEWRVLRSFDFDSASELILEPSGLDLPIDFLQTAYRESGGHPMLLQYIMHEVVKAPNQYGERLQSAVREFERTRRWQFGEWWERYCSPLARRIYSKLPADGSRITRRQITSEFGSDESAIALDVLCHTGLAVEEDDGFAYRYSMEMFRRWYNESATPHSDELFDANIYGRLLELDRQAADKYLSAWRSFGSELSDYAGSAALIRETLTMVLDQVAPVHRMALEPGFSPDRASGPSRRQRVHYAAKQRFQNSSSDITNLGNDLELIESECEMIAMAASSTYQSTSGLVHSYATRDQVYQTLKQWDVILEMLLPPVVWTESK